MNDTPSEFVNFVFAACARGEPMPEIRVVTLSHYAFEHEYPKRTVVVQPQIFVDDCGLSIALDIDALDEFSYESVLKVLLNLNDNVNLSNLKSPCYFGNPVVMHWHDSEQSYVRGNPSVSEFTTVERSSICS